MAREEGIRDNVDTAGENWECEDGICGALAGLILAGCNHGGVDSNSSSILDQLVVLGTISHHANDVANEWQPSGNVRWLLWVAVWEEIS